MLAAALIMAVGCSFQAAVGFGFALLAVPLLTFIDPRFIPGPILLAAIPLCLWSAWRERAAIDRNEISLSLSGMIVGTVIGALALQMFTGPSLPKLFGALILLAIVLSLAAPAVKVSRAALLLGGGAGGFMGTMVGVHGPPLAIVLQHAEPARFRAVMGAYFAVAFASSVLALWLFGLFGRDDLGRTLIVLPGTFVGMAIGPHLAHHVDRRRLRLIVLSVSTISALALLLR
jgi:uncharacterized membrane protein YfcA